MRSSGMLLAGILCALGGGQALAENPKLETTADLVEFCHHTQGVTQHVLPFLRDDHAPAVPVEETDAQFLLQQSYLTAQCRLGDMQTIRCFGQAAKLGDVDQRTKLRNIHPIQYRYI